MTTTDRDAVLLQEYYKEEPWRVLVCCTLLNQCSRSQVDRVLDGHPSSGGIGLFERYPSARAWVAGSDTVKRGMLRPLGLQNVRVDRLNRLSREWVDLVEDANAIPSPPSEEQVARLYGVGEYALDSYCFFVLRDFSHFRSGDKELKEWLRRWCGKGGGPVVSAIVAGMDDGAEQSWAVIERKIEEGW